MWSDAMCFWYSRKLYSLHSSITKHARIYVLYMNTVRQVNKKKLSQTARVTKSFYPFSLHFNDNLFLCLQMNFHSSSTHILSQRALTVSFGVPASTGAIFCVRLATHQCRILSFLFFFFFFFSRYSRGCFLLFIHSIFTMRVCT